VTYPIGTTFFCEATTETGTKRAGRPIRPSDIMRFGEGDCMFVASLKGNPCSLLIETVSILNAYSGFSIYIEALVIGRRMTVMHLGTSHVRWIQEAPPTSISMTMLSVDLCLEDVTDHELCLVNKITAECIWLTKPGQTLATTRQMINVSQIPRPHTRH
jgi:hypothetical protein